MKLYTFCMALLILFLGGCASLMMHTTELSKNEELFVTKGKTVSIREIKLSDEVLEKIPPLTEEQFKKKLRKTLAKELKAEGVLVKGSSKNSVTVNMTKFDRGCSFCRGFFPVFGLGNTYMDGEVQLRTAKGRRVFLIEKKGQSSGITTMGDQTDRDIGYFATKVASELVDEAEEN